MRENKTKWVNQYLSEIFSITTSSSESYTKRLIENPGILDIKNDKIPTTLFKFFFPSYDNILDMKNQRIWCSHPSSFNDLYDCSIGYDIDEFEKKKTLEIMKSRKLSKNLLCSNNFTENDYNRVLNSTTNFDKSGYRYNGKTVEYFNDVMRKIYEDKSDDFERRVYQKIRSKINDIEEKIGLIQSNNIRVSCFANLNRYDDFPKMAQMWAHYADNHRGYCVEYDISTLKENKEIKTPFMYQDEKKYFEERLDLVLKGSLFPVSYSSKRVKIPYTELNQLSKLPKKNIKKIPSLEELLFKAYVNKSTVWNYEKEWRVIIEDRICEYYDNKIPFPFAKCIYIGARMEEKKKDMLIAIGEELDIKVNIMNVERDNYLLGNSDTWLYKYSKDRKKDNNPYF